MRKHHKQALITLQTVAMEENASQTVRNVLRLVEKGTMEEAHSTLALLGSMMPSLPPITGRLCRQLRYQLEVEIRIKAEKLRGERKAPTVEEAEPPTH